MKITDFQEVKYLGQGNLAKCCLAIHKQSGKQYVLKQIDTHQMSNKQIDLCLQQARILHILNHPNIIQLNGQFINQDQSIVLVLEYASGGDLYRKITQSSTNFSEITIVEWFTQICFAVKHTHQNRIIHRDIKSQNVFLTAEGIIKLGDFGVSTILQQTLQKANTVIGTPYYISPEICQNKGYSYQTDIWSLGVLLYELCARKPPFIAQSLAGLVMKICRGQYNRDCLKNYSKALRRLIDSMLQVDGSKRPTIELILKNELICGKRNKMEDNFTKTPKNIKIHSNKTNNMKQKRAKDLRLSPNIDYCFGSPRINNNKRLSPMKSPIFLRFPDVFRQKSQSQLTPQTLRKDERKLDFKVKKTDKIQLFQLGNVNKLQQINEKCRIKQQQQWKYYCQDDMTQRIFKNQVVNSNVFDQNQDIIQTLQQIIIGKIGYLKFLRFTKKVTTNMMFNHYHFENVEALMVLWYGLKIKSKNIF